MDDWLFQWSLWLALIVAGLGLLWRIIMWLTVKVGPEATGISCGTRLKEALGAIGRLIFSSRVGGFLASLVLDGLFQRRSWSHSRWAGIMHLGLFGGTIILILMHALEGQITARLFPDYASTVNPYLFLRNLLGAMVIIGLAIAFIRRLTRPSLKRISGWADWFVLILLAVIILSGFFLEATKIGSYRDFNRMAEDFSGLDAEDDAEAMMGLKIIWADNYGVVFPKGQLNRDEADMEAGAETHDMSCLACHSKPTAAFVSYPLSWLLRPIEIGLVNLGAGTWLFQIHFLATFLALALLPWTKFFHILQTPLMLAINQVTDRSKTSPANLATLRAMELLACTHCGACSEHCSVWSVFKVAANLAILPSEKVAGFKRLAARQLTDDQMEILRAGADVCTNCYRCTNICPSGINLDQLWIALKDDLLAMGMEPAERQAMSAAGHKAAISRQKTPVAGGREFRNGLNLSAQADSFQACFRCQTCTNECPVVAQAEEAQADLDLLPHQIMHSLGLGLAEEAMGAKMTWLCLTCFKCQEACPQGVKVTEVLIELKNRAVAERPGWGG